MDVAREEIRSGLANSDPQTFIDKFQEEHGLQEGASRSVLPILDHHGVSRQKVLPWLALMTGLPQRHGEAPR